MRSPREIYFHILLGAGAVTYGGWRALLIVLASVGAVDLFHWCRQRARASPP